MSWIMYKILGSAIHKIWLCAKKINLISYTTSALEWIQSRSLEEPWNPWTSSEISFMDPIEYF